MPTKPQPMPTTEVIQTAPVRPQNFMELERFATMAAKSDFVPKDYRGRPDNIMVAIQMGSEVGLAPMQSLQNIAVINGRPALWGDAMLGLIKASYHFEDIQETMEGEADDRTAKCIVRRRGQSPVLRTFSVQNAKTAGLWGKNVWASYPDRMLQMRARGFALRDAFPDVLRGLISAEEAQDSPQTIVGRVEELPPEPPMRVPGAAQKLDASKSPPAAKQPPAPPSKPGNGNGGGSAQFRAWFEQTWNAIDAAPSLAHAVTVLRQALKPEWTGPILEKIKLHEQWEWKISQSKYGAALNAFLEEQMAERDRQQAAPASAEEPQP